MTYIIGIGLLVLLMLSVMGGLLSHCLKIDRAYEATKGQPEAVRIKAWYKR
jgi:hypothetical protein